MISAVGLLGNHAFKFHGLHQPEEFFAFFQNMVVVPDVFGFYQRVLQQLFPLEEAEVFRGMPIQPEQVKNLIYYCKIWMVTNALKPLEIRLSLIIISDKFTVQHHLVLLKFKGVAYFFKFFQIGKAVAGIQLNPFSQISDGAVAVPLYFKRPLRRAEGLVCDARQHWGDELSQFFFSTQGRRIISVRFYLPASGAYFFTFFFGIQIGGNLRIRCGVLFGIIMVSCKFISVLDEEPRFAVLRTLDFHEGEFPFELFTVQDEFKGTFMQFMLHQQIVGFALCFFQRFIGTFVPDFHFSGAVISFGNGAFECAVGKRVVFHHHRKPLVFRIQRGTFGNSPTFQHPIHLQAEIIVEPARCMPLNNKLQLASAAGCFSFWFCSLFEIAFFVVFF